MVTDNNTMQAVLNDALILLFDGRINAVKDLLPILERVSQENKSLLIIAEDIDGEALSTLIVNKMRGILKVAAVKAPDFGERRTLILEDIAIVTGGTVVSPQKGMKLEKFSTDWFGQARTITIGKETTTIVDGKGETEKIDTRIDELKAQIDTNNSPYEAERLQDRLAKMVGGVAIINVGGGTEVEMKERKDRIDDALQATKAALEEGIVPGAGMALFNARNAINNRDNSDSGLGGQIVYKACSTPLNKILTNAGEDYHEWVSVFKNSKNAVPDIIGDRTVDAFKSGIIDPTKVVRCALENAAAAAVTLLMTECVIHDKPTDKKKEEVDLAGFGM
jgi:chaperonin GroEL